LFKPGGHPLDVLVPSGQDPGVDEGDAHVPLDVALGEPIEEVMGDALAAGGQPGEKLSAAVVSEPDDEPPGLVRRGQRAVQRRQLRPDHTRRIAEQIV
jgi:hypothetical protein